MLIKFLLAFFQISISLENCHKNCEECYFESEDEFDMGCTSCKEGYYFLHFSSNCFDRLKIPNNFIADDSIFFCDYYFYEENCYECDPYMDTIGSCLSCETGYVLNEETKECQKCESNWELIPLKYRCKEGYYENCYLYFTCCNSLDNCNLNISSHCEESGFIDSCFYSNKSNIINKVNYLFYDGKEDSLMFPSLNIDNSGYLLIESTIMDLEVHYDYSSKNQVKRKLFFYNEEGRGFFDELNDESEKIVGINKYYMRGISSSIALKLNDSEEYRYLLNFESYNNNL